MESTVLGIVGETIELNSNLQHEPSTRITEREVWEAANNLWVKKVDPSSNKVRELLGNRGSFRTIQMYLDTWRRQEIEQPALDDPLWQELVKMRKKYEQQAKMIATNQIQAIQQECEHKLLESQEFQRHIEQERDTFAIQFQELQTFTENLKESHQLLNNQYNEQEKNLYLAEQTNRTLENEMQKSKDDSQKQLNSQSRDYENQLSRLNMQFEHDKKQLSEKINLLEKDNDELKLSFGNLITDLRLNNQELELVVKQSKEKEVFYNAEIEKINSLYAKSQEKIHHLKNEKLSLSEKMHHSEKELSISQEKLKQANTHIDDLKQQNKDQQKQLLDYSAKLGQFDEIISSLHKRLKKEKPAKP